MELCQWLLYFKKKKKNLKGLKIHTPNETTPPPNLNETMSSLIEIKHMDLKKNKGSRCHLKRVGMLTVEWGCATPPNLVRQTLQHVSQAQKKTTQNIYKKEPSRGWTRCTFLPLLFFLS